MASIGKLVVTLTTRTGQFQKGLKGARKTLGSFASDMKMIGKRAAVFGTVLAGAGAVGAFKLVQIASEFEETAGKFAAVFKELTPEAETFTAGMAKELGRSRAQLTGFMATLQDTFVPLGFARREAFEMSGTLTRLAVDLASFNNKAEPDVIRDLQSAIVGNTETLRKYGVIINQASLSQELMNMGIAGGAREASEAQKAQARLNILLAGTTDAQGDAIRTASGYANQVRALSASIEDVAITMGSALLPVAKSVVQTLSGMAGWIKAQSPIISAWIKDLIEGGKMIGTWFVKQLTRFVESGIFAFAFWETAISNWQAVTKFGISSVQLTFVKFGDQIKHLFTVVIPANLVFLGRAFMAWGKTASDLFKATFTNLFNNAKTFWKDFITVLAGGTADFKFTSLVKGFEATIPKMTSIAERIPSALEKALEKDVIIAGTNLGKSVAQAAEARLAKFRAFIGDVIPDAAAPKIADTAKKLGDAIGNKVGGKIEQAVGRGLGPEAIEKGTVQAYSATLRTAFVKIADTGKKTVEKMAESVKVQKEGNQLLADNLGQTATVGIEG